MQNEEEDKGDNYDDDSDDNAEEEEEDAEEDSSSDRDDGDSKGGPASKKASRKEMALAIGAGDNDTAKETTAVRRLSYWKKTPSARGIIQTVSKVRAVCGETESKGLGSGVNRREVTMPTAAPTKDASLIQCDLVVLSQDSMTKFYLLTINF
jgi:hypothetical protein